MNEKEFSEKLRPWLDRSAREVGDLQAVRLKAARLRALEAYQEPRLWGILPAGMAARVSAHPAIWHGLVWLPVAALVTFFGMKALAPAPDLGELDAQILASEVPLEALVDKDFGEWLKNAQRR